MIQRDDNLRDSGSVSVSAPAETGKRTGAPVSGSGSKKAVVSRRVAHRPRYINVKQEKKTPFPLATVLFLTVITLLFIFMMMNYAEIDKYNSSVTELQNTVADLQEQQKKLDLRLENKDNRSAYEKYASEELGMVKSDALNKYIITLNPEDKTEIMEYDDGKDTGFGYLLSGLAEVLRDFFS
ncbi:MAG: septum formation initiator family protein [Clostridia bacterium]|nr:septum formation initiator family protein [Clostridia bacterium]